jgi:hypothetical protein
MACLIQSSKHTCASAGCIVIELSDSFYSLNLLHLSLSPPSSSSSSPSPPPPLFGTLFIHPYIQGAAIRVIQCANVNVGAFVVVGQRVGEHRI